MNSYEKNTNHLQWEYDRMINVHNENPNYDYMIKFRDIIGEYQDVEDKFNAFIKFVETKN
jgi:hypothetical protein